MLMDLIFSDEDVFHFKDKNGKNHIISKSLISEYNISEPKIIDGKIVCDVVLKTHTPYINIDITINKDGTITNNV